MEGHESSLNPAALYISNGSNPDRARVTKLEQSWKTSSLEHPLSPLGIWLLRLLEE